MLKLAPRSATGVVMSAECHPPPLRYLEPKSDVSPLCGLGGQIEPKNMVLRLAITRYLSRSYRRLDHAYPYRFSLALPELQSWDQEHSGLRQHIAPLREAVLIGAKRVPIETVVSNWLIPLRDVAACHGQQQVNGLQPTLADN